MRKTIVAAAVAASIAAGGVAGAAVGTPPLAGAARAAATTVGWVDDALSGLVDDGTITEEQADAVEAALEEARPEHRGWHPGHLRLSGAAEALGISEAELLEALRDGQTLAQVAEAQGVEVQALVDALVGALEERLARAVEAGRITQERADEVLAGADERIADLVAGEMPLRRRAGGLPRGGPGAHGQATDVDDA